MDSYRKEGKKTVGEDVGSGERSGRGCGSSHKAVPSCTWIQMTVARSTCPLLIHILCGSRRFMGFDGMGSFHRILSSHPSNHFFPSIAISIDISSKRPSNGSIGGWRGTTLSPNQTAKQTNTTTADDHQTRTKRAWKRRLRTFHEPSEEHEAAVGRRKVAASVGGKRKEDLEDTSQGLKGSIH